MPEHSVTRPHMAIRKFGSYAEQEAEDIRYWNSRTIAYKMQATVELIEYNQRLKGIDGSHPGSDRSIVRLQRTLR